MRSPYAHAPHCQHRHSGSRSLAWRALHTDRYRDRRSRRNPFIEIGPDPAGKIKDYPLAVGKVRYQGEPVVAVVAESARLADDAAELVQVEYESLDPVVDAQDALTDKSVLHEECGTNKVWNGVFEYGDVEQAFRDAASCWSISIACTFIAFRLPRWRTTS